MVCDTLDINITVDLSMENSTKLWKDYENNMYDVGLFLDYLQIKFPHVTTYNWSTDYNCLTLYFDKEEYKTWFLLNHEWQRKYI